MTFTVRCRDGGSGAINLLLKGQEYQAALDPTNPLIYMIRIGKTEVPFLRGRFDPATPPLEATDTVASVIPRKVLGERIGPICPRCGLAARLVDVRYNGGFECCGLRSWGGKPLVDQRTINARKAAHLIFDAVWRSRKIERGQAYKRLAAHMGLSLEQCHMAAMDAETAERVPAAVRALWPEILNDVIAVSLEEYGG